MSTLTRQAYDHIHKQILSGTLAPGDTVSEAVLAGQLGISRTPVGDAIRQLALEGLVEQVPRYGTIIKGIDRRELIDLYEMREAVESYAAAKAAERISPNQLEQLRVLCDAMREIADAVGDAGREELTADELQHFLAADMAFHMTIIRACGNRRMQRTIAETRTISRIFQVRRQKHDRRTVQDAHAWHARVLEALRKGETEKARQVMAEHIAASKAQSLNRMDVDEPGPADGDALPAGLPADLARRLKDIGKDET